MSINADVAKSLFGANLAEQGRGFYVALELFALVRGTLEASQQILPDGDDLLLNLRSHDFARRLAGDVTGESPPIAITDREAAAAFATPETRAVLARLVDALVMPVPGRRKSPTFKQRALYPYIGELVHYDAVDRWGKIAMERNTSRGAGGLAHKILRTDANHGRLTRNRQGLRSLIGDTGSNLGRVMDALRAHDVAPAKDGWTDEEEQRAAVAELSAWPEYLCAGVDRIVQSNLPAARRVERIMHWVPYCIARHQAEVAFTELGETAPAIPVDLRDERSALRAEARRSFDLRVAAIHQALSTRAERMAVGTDADDPERRFALLQAAEHRPWKPWVTFHGQTLAICGALNAMTGPRYSTFRLPFLEALVGATLSPGEELPVEAFCSTIAERYDLVVDRVAAEKRDLLHSVDANEFTRNREALVGRLRDLGLIAEFSDQTRLVRAVAA
jgi:hypothetical protein